MTAVLSTEYLLGCQVTCSMHETVQGHMFDLSLIEKRGTSHNTTSKYFILNQETQTENKFPSSWNTWSLQMRFIGCSEIAVVPIYSSLLPRTANISLLLSPSDIVASGGYVRKWSASSDRLCVRDLH